MISIDDRGAGDPAIVLIHGGLSDRTDWHFQFSSLSKRWRVVALDLPGHGSSRTDAPAQSCTIEAFAETVCRLIDELGLSRPTLVGHSLGCRVAIEANHRMPGSVSGLVLVDQGRYATGDAAVAAQRAVDLLNEVGHRNALAGSFATMFVDSTDPSLRERVIERATAAPRDVAAVVLPSTYAWDAARLEPALKDIDVPVLAIQSTYVDLDGARVSLQSTDSSPFLDLLRVSVRDLRVEIVEGVGHYCMLEAPDVVSDAIAAFVTGLALNSASPRSTSRREMEVNHGFC